MAILVLKGLLSDIEDQSLIGEIAAFREVGVDSKILGFQLEPDEIFEASLLGHSNLTLDQGPLTVAALGANPPERSIHFHVSLLSLAGDTLQTPTPPNIEEFKVISERIRLLNTRNLTMVLGEGLDHALVSERMIEIITSKPSEARSVGLLESLPRGEGDNELRRFIDDSVNLLAEEEFNLRRIDHGFHPINICWPWGQGERQRVPNRAIALGYPWNIQANSLAIRGLSRLSGFRTNRLPTSGFPELLATIQKEDRSLTLMEFNVPAIDDQKREDYERRIHDLASQLIGPLLEWKRVSKSPLTIVTSDTNGRGLIGLIAKENERDHFPFDERSLREKKVESCSLTQLLDLGA